MAIYELGNEEIRKIEETTFCEAGIKERDDLQRLLRRQIEIIAPDTLVISEEFGEWDESRRRIDLLAIDRNANLVVIELKRTEDGGHMELQALRYAAMVSTLTFNKVIEIYGKYLRQISETIDPKASILEFLGWEEEDEDAFAQDVRIVLASAEFSKELTTAVLWLNSRDVSISCVRMRPYQDGDRLLVDVQQVIPLPEAAEYQVQVREKAKEVRKQNAAAGLQYKFWEQLLLYALQKTPLHADVSPRERNWVGVNSPINELLYNYVIREKDGDVELYIDGGTGQRDTNKKLFDWLHEKKNTIENSFGEALTWDRCDQTGPSKIRFKIESAGYKSDPSKWPKMREEMVTAMIRLEAAISPYLDACRTECGISS